ncbi:hypothetical protein OROGR_028768 [Orobanche gracilis]
MSFPSGKREIPAALRQENKRMLDKTIRQLERERQGLKTQQMKLTDEIKKSAKQGEMRAVIVMAEDLIKTRHHLSDVRKLKASLRTQEIKIETSNVGCNEKRYRGREDNNNQEGEPAITTENHARIREAKREDGMNK